MPPLVQVLILAVVQGVTEFLPISSDGHLAVTMALLAGLGQKVSDDAHGVTVLLHIGTLAAIVVYFRHELWRLLGADRRVIGLLILGTIPAVVLGLVAKKFFSEYLTLPSLTGVMLVVNGLMLLWGARRPRGEQEYPELSPAQALTIGLAQALAILPGISRSGTTIVTGTALGLRREAAANFSFLLAVPVVAGACLLELLDLFTEEGLAIPPIDAALGIVTAFVVGLFALSWLLDWLARGRLAYFAWWCIGVGVLVTAWQLWSPTA